MNVIIMDLHKSWKWVVLIELQLSYSELNYIYGELQLCNSCNLSITFTMYKCNELQMSNATQKLSCKASFKITFFSTINLGLICALSY
jgi:hypothetical protein